MIYRPDTLSQISLINDKLLSAVQLPMSAVLGGHGSGIAFVSAANATCNSFE